MGRRRLPPASPSAPTLGIDMEITARNPGTRASPISKRWAVEQTYDGLMLYRRLPANTPNRAEAMIHLAMTSLVVRRSWDEASDGNGP